MEIEGKVIAVLPEKKGTSKATGNEWMAQEYVIETHEQYPKRCCFEVFGADRIAGMAIKAGEELRVSFDIDARQWQDRWFNSIRAWKVERIDPAAAPGMPTPPPADAFGPAPAPAAGVAGEAPFAQGGADDNTSDLPF